MSPVETAPGRKQREAPLHDRLNRSSDIIPSDADTTAIRKHLGKRASAGAAAAGGIWCKGTVCGSGFLIWLFSLMHETLLCLQLFHEILFSWLLQPEAKTTCPS